MKKTPSLNTVLRITSALMLLPYGTQAETVNYGALEELFGEPVTTSATGTPQRASDVAADMTIITAEQIRRSGSRNIPQVIGQYVPGIDIMQNGINAFDVGVRGYQQPFQPRLLVLLDGRQVFIDDYSRTVWDAIPVNIDDISSLFNRACWCWSMADRFSSAIIRAPSGTICRSISKMCARSK